MTCGQLADLIAGDAEFFNHHAKFWPTPNGGEICLNFNDRHYSRDQIIDRLRIAAYSHRVPHFFGRLDYLVGSDEDGILFFIINSGHVRRVARDGSGFEQCQTRLVSQLPLKAHAQSGNVW